MTGPGGLSQKDVDTRVSQGLVNHSVRRTGRRTVDIIRSNVFTRINAMLGVLLIIVLSTGSWINAAFGLLIVVNSSIGIIQELRAKRTLDRLTIVGESKPTVIREGEHISVLRDELVLDDLIDLGSGDQLVVDGVVRSADGLMVDESLLTGESDPVLKKPGDAVFSGSFVSSGQGTYQATAIGDDAYAARLIAEAGRFQLTDSRLQAGINSILQLITYLLVPTGILTIWTQLSRTGAPLRDALLSMVAALVPMVPEGLVLMTSIAFAVGVVRLGRRNALINELPAIEGLARVNVVCTDKTGTLTENRMELEHIQLLGDTSLDTVHRVLQGFVAADNRPNDTLHAIAEGVGDEDFGDEVLDCVAFDSARKWSGVSLVELGDWVLGAPDVLLPAGSETLEQAQPLEAGANRFELKRVGGGLLVQTPDIHRISRADLKVVSKRQPTEQEWNDLLFVWNVAKYVKSNAIVFGKGGQTYGIGAGQMSRVDSTRIAARKAQDAGLDLNGACAASDAFFPFRDGVDVIAEQGIKAIIHPAGSMRDQEVFDAADEHGIAMVVTGVRHFRH